MAKTVKVGASVHAQAIHEIQKLLKTTTSRTEKVGMLKAIAVIDHIVLERKKLAQKKAKEREEYYEGMRRRLRTAQVTPYGQPPLLRVGNHTDIETRQTPIRFDWNEPDEEE